MGGTRFVGKSLVSLLSQKKHEITLFTRGLRPAPETVEHLVGDRANDVDLQALRGRSFDVIIDSSGRRLKETQQVLALTGPPKYRFLYLSSAGVYENTGFWPLSEDSKIDPNSRHYGKVETENWLIQASIPFTSFRPTYIYGPGNYNPIEKWFFDRLLHGRPLPLPGDGSTITQLGHVSDLANAIYLSLSKEVSCNRIYNCSSKKGVTFLGLVKSAALACNIDIDQVDLRSFNPKVLDPKARKLFPLRLSHFLTDITRLESDLDWEPKFDLVKGLTDSYRNDYLLNSNSNPDFSNDAVLIGD